MDGISKAATVLAVLMKVYNIPCHYRGHINVVLVLQSCSDSLRILPNTSSDTYVASPECACHFGDMKVEEDVDMQVQEEEEVNVKTETGTGSEEEECICIKDEEFIYSEEEEEEGVHIKEEEWDYVYKRRGGCGDKSRGEFRGYNIMCCEINPEPP